MKEYKVTLYRTVEHETTYKVSANDEDEAIDLVFDGHYDEVTQDCEISDTNSPEVADIEEL